MTSLDDLPATVLRTCAEACGVGAAEVATGNGAEAIEARQLTLWLLHKLSELAVVEMGLCIGRTGEQARQILSAAYSRRRRDPIWRAKATRLLERIKPMVGEEEVEPEQLDLLAAVDTSSQSEPCNNWGFEQARPKRYFADINEEAKRVFRAGLAQEAKEREEAA